MITLSIKERELLLQILRDNYSPEKLRQLFDEGDVMPASDAIAKQCIRLENWIAEEKSRERPA